MKTLITVLFMLVTNLAVGQDKFPAGYNPDGKIGQPVITLLYDRGILRHGFPTLPVLKYQSDSWALKLELPADRQVTVFGAFTYGKSSHEFDQRNKDKYFDTHFQIGIKFFGGIVSE